MERGARSNARAPVNKYNQYKATGYGYDSGRNYRQHDLDTHTPIEGAQHPGGILNSLVMMICVFSAMELKHRIDLDTVARIREEFR